MNKTVFYLKRGGSFKLLGTYRYNGVVTDIGDVAIESAIRSKDGTLIATLEFSAVTGLGNYKLTAGSGTVPERRERQAPGVAARPAM